MGTALEVFSDLSEHLNYNLPDFPLYVRIGELNQFDRYAAACHWHADLEFILSLTGSMEYFVNGQTVLIEKGNGIFVNSKRLHYGFSTIESNCSFIVVAIHPSLLGADTAIGKAYLDEKFGPGTDDFLLLTSQSSWQKEILVLLEQLYDEMHSCTRNPLLLLSQSAAVCALIGNNIQPISGQTIDHQAWMLVRTMTGFIHKHYEHKITIDDIAAAGAVCRSKCCTLFRNYVGKSPNDYLMQYRIQKSCEMLNETGRSISEIAVTCGFQSPSYYAFVFHKAMGLVPQDYRKQTSTNKLAQG